MDFYSHLKQTQDNVSITENGAIGYKTTGKELTDFFFKVSSFRNLKDIELEQECDKLVKSADPYLLKLAFYIRDAREGLGERRLFKQMMNALIKANFEGKKEFFQNVITKWIPLYGRYDDLFLFMDTPYELDMMGFIQDTLVSDLKNLAEGKPITLMAKWLPSINASSKESKKLGRTVARALDLTERDYRKTLSKLRAYNNVVEIQMCAKEWGAIDYNKVPSKANIKYKNAFLRNDEERRRQYLNDLVRGVDKEGKEVKINSTVNTPHEVLHMYNHIDWSWWGDRSTLVSPYDEAVEQLWKNLKELPGLKDTIVVRDDSGSMTSTINGTRVTAYEVATALGIYCAEHNTEAYKNKIISFSQTPKYLDFSDSSKYGSLHSKYAYLVKHSEVANTNIKAVFDLVLKTAVENKLPAEELPAQILIISDMEFDSCGGRSCGISLFNQIASDYAQYGYKLPKLVFWNVCGRTGTIPCKQNDAGVILVSGFSQNVLNLVNRGETDPYISIVKELDTERYSDIPLYAKLDTRVKKEKYKSPLEK